MPISSRTFTFTFTFTTAIDYCLWIVTHIRHASYGRRHVVPSTVSLAGMSRLAGV